MLQETNLGLDLNGIHQALAYADISLIGNDIRTLNWNADVLLNACKDDSLTVNIGKSKYTPNRMSWGNGDRVRVYHGR